MLKKKSVLVGLVLFGFSLTSVLGQTVDEAKKAFNRGVIYMQKSDLDSAISSLERTVKICNEVGPDADLVRVKAETKIPGLYYKRAMNLYKEKKLDEAISGFEKTEEVSKQYNDVNTEKKAVRIIPQLYNIKGNQYYKAEKYDEAIENYNKAIDKDSEFAKAYFGKGLVAKKQEDEAAFNEAMKKAIEKGEASGDDDIVEKAQKLAGNYYLNKGIKAKKSTDYQAASENLKKSVSFNDDAEKAFYLLALVSNEIKDWDQAIEASEEAKELAEGDNEEISKINFQLGRAYQGKGNNEEACNAYKNVTTGPYVKSAKYQLEHGLKCN